MREDDKRERGVAALLGVDDFHWKEWRERGGVAGESRRG